MTLYLDASALTKAYLDEAGSAEARGALEADQTHATSVVSYAEVRATFARASRDGRLDRLAHQEFTTQFDAHWLRFASVPLDQRCLKEAGAAADRHPRHALRALDSIHLASALRIAAGDPATVSFACWDIRLWRAARDEGFAMLPPNEPE